MNKSLCNRKGKEKEPGECLSKMLEGEEIFSTAHSLESGVNGS